MTPVLDFLSSLSRRAKLIIGTVLILACYAYYVSGITENPPGFYIDEAATAYNAHALYATGAGEFGHFLPLYLPVFDLQSPMEYLGYLDPVQIYIIAALHFFFPPSYALPRLVSATSMFLMALTLAVLAWRISRKWTVTALTFATGLLTPWLFEMGRLGFGAALYPLVISLLLFTLYRATRKVHWTYLDCILISFSLALTTYTYGVGRLLGPLFALGLLIAVTSVKSLLGVLKIWVGYALLMIPIVIFHFQNPNALAGRFNMTVGIIKPDKSWGDILYEFVGRYAANTNPMTLLFSGDPNLRHHLVGSAAVLAVTLLLGVIGIFLVFTFLRKDGWWRFVVFGLLVAAIPSSLTVEAFHSLRLSAFPVFLVALTIPLLTYLSTGTWAAKYTEAQGRTPGLASKVAFGVFAFLTLAQGIWWQTYFIREGRLRGGWFDTGFVEVFDAALAQEQRPIYLLDHTYYHALWRAKVLGIDEKNFVQLPVGTRPPANSMVMSMEEKCTVCEVVGKFDAFIAYRNFKPASSDRPDANAEDVSFPRGIAADRDGNYYIADTKNARIRKYSPDGKVLLTFGTYGEGSGNLREPHGVAVDQAGNVYVTDSASHKLLRFGKTGTFEKEWTGPGFYGPRDVEIGPNGDVYVVDQGRTRIVQFSPASETFNVWGTAGGGQGQFNDPTGIGIGANLIFVSDTGNGRIVVYDLRGGYQREWRVDQWKNNTQYFPDIAVDEEANLIYVSVSVGNEMAAYDFNGAPAALPPAPAGKLRNPSSLVISHSKSGRRLLVLNTVAGDGSDPAYSRVSIYPLTGAVK